MARYNVREAETQLSKLLDRVLEGGEVLITRDGVPVAQLVPTRKRGVILGSGVGDPNCNPNATDDWWRPMTDEEFEDFLEGRY